MVAVGIVLFVIAAFWLIVGLLGATRKLPGNKYIGLRTAEVRKYAETWDVAHAVAGPMWIVAGVAFGFAGAIALTATGWMWLLVVLGAVAGVLAISFGSNLGARAAYLDAVPRAEAEVDGGCSDGSCNCGSGGCTPAADVNLDALRTAARATDTQ